MRKASLWIGVLVAVFVTASCAASPDQPTSSTSLGGGVSETTISAVQESAEEVQTALTQVSLVMGEVEEPDAMLAWSDLNADLSSSVRDLQRDPDSVDIAGLQMRLDSFMNRFGLEAEPVWQALIVAFETFVDTLDTTGFQ